MTPLFIMVLYTVYFELSQCCLDKQTDFTDVISSLSKGHIRISNFDLEKPFSFLTFQSLVNLHRLCVVCSPVAVYNTFVNSQGTWDWAYSLPEDQGFSHFLSRRWNIETKIKYNNMLCKNHCSFTLHLPLKTPMDSSLEFQSVVSMCSTPCISLEAW